MILFLLAPLLLNLALDHFSEKVSLVKDQGISFSLFFLFLINSIYLGLEVSEPQIYVVSFLVGSILLKKELDATKKLIAGLTLTFLQPLIWLGFSYGEIILTLALSFSFYLYLKERKLSSFSLVLLFTSILTLFDIKPSTVSIFWTFSIYSSLYILTANSDKREALLATIACPLLIFFPPTEAFYSSELLRALMMLLMLLRRDKKGLLVGFALLLLMPVDINENPSFIGMLLPTLFFTMSALDIVFDQVIVLERDKDGKFVLSGYEIGLLVLMTLFLIGLPFTPGSYFQKQLSGNLLSQISILFFLLVSTLETNKTKSKTRESAHPWFSFFPLFTVVFYTFITYTNKVYVFNFYFLFLFVFLVTTAFFEERNFFLQKLVNKIVSFFRHDFPSFRFLESPNYKFNNKTPLNLVDVKMAPIRDPIFVVLSTLGISIFVCWRLL